MHTHTQKLSLSSTHHLPSSLLRWLSNSRLHPSIHPSIHPSTLPPWEASHFSWVCTLPRSWGEARLHPSPRQRELGSTDSWIKYKAAEGKCSRAGQQLLLRFVSQRAHDRPRTKWSVKCVETSAGCCAPSDALEGVSVLGMGRRTWVLLFDGVTGRRTPAPAWHHGAASTPELDTKPTLEAPRQPQALQPWVDRMRWISGCVCWFWSLRWSPQRKLVGLFSLLLCCVSSSGSSFNCLSAAVNLRSSRWSHICLFKWSVVSDSCLMCVGSYMLHTVDKRDC